MRLSEFDMNFLSWANQGENIAKKKKKKKKKNKTTISARFFTLCIYASSCITILIYGYIYVILHIKFMKNNKCKD